LEATLQSTAREPSQKLLLLETLSEAE
jgi:hypothetical protein